MNKNSKMKSLVICAIAAAAVAGTPTTASAQGCFIGEIKWKAFNFTERNYMAAQGQLLPISQYTALFSVYGTTYGGDGRSTFALPDLRGRAPMHAGTGPGMASRRLGQQVGAENVTLNQLNLASHTHAASTVTTLEAATSDGDTPNPDGRYLANDGRDRIYVQQAPNVDMAANTASSSTTVAAAGAPSATINNVQPSLVLNPQVCVNGTYPSRS